ncbi:TolB family protein [Flagellimonas meishanensis]|uniref:TolB family protein n=1 Tax=Flagellimonas meishanensis TaxID=2873264 RepID=UPI001CA76027|nr:hypothetical protein [[Muricauda] meishanensis]
MGQKAVLISILTVVCSAILAQDGSTNELILTNNDFEDRYASYSPDGKQILFESKRNGKWGIYLMDDRGNGERKLTMNANDNRRPSWHPNGKKVLFESFRDGRNGLYTLNIKSGKEKPIIKGGKGLEFIFAMYSPNGKKIAVSTKENENKSNIVLLGNKGRLVEWLTKNEYRNLYPKWSTNGKEIVFFSRKDTDNIDDEIYRINLETGQEIRLTNWPRHNFCPLVVK